MDENREIQEELVLDFKLFNKYKDRDVRIEILGGEKVIKLKGKFIDVIKVIYDLFRWV